MKNTNTTTVVIAVLIASLASLGGAAGLSAHSSHAAPGSASPSASAPFHALAYLASSQASDGHWSNGNTSIQATALCLSAFLRMGESSSSHRYGKYVSKAYDWLAKAEPTTEKDRIAMIVALSDFYTLHRIPIAAEKVKDLLAVLNIADVGAWGDLLSYARLPAGATRPPSLAKIKDTDAKYEDCALNAVLESVDGYLQMYLTSQAKYRTGGKTWTVYQRTYTPLLVARQRADGAFSTENEADRPAATALAVMSFAQLHAGALQFCPAPEPKAEQEDTDAEIEIDIRVGTDGSMTTREVTPTESGSNINQALGLPPPPPEPEKLDLKALTSEL